jgi:hypothetical protein
LAHDRQKRKSFLSVNRPFVTLDRPKLSFRIQRNQSVTPFSFLVLKSPSIETADGARIQSAGDGGGYQLPFARMPQASSTNNNEVNNSSKPLIVQPNSIIETPEARGEAQVAFRKR